MNTRKFISVAADFGPMGWTLRCTGVCRLQKRIASHIWGEGLIAAGPARQLYTHTLFAVILSDAMYLFLEVAGIYHPLKIKAWM
jgi:hypothetical protein